MALYLGNNKVSLNSSCSAGGMKGYFGAGGKCGYSKISDFSSILKNTDTTYVLDMSCMFNSCSEITTIPLLNTFNSTNMYRMFYNCSKLTTIPLLKTSNVTNMGGMFERCYNLTEIPLLDTSSVVGMFNMFALCYSLTSIPRFNTSNVEDMSDMFSGCSSLTEIPALDVSKVTNMNNMFYNCSSLTAIHMTDINADLDISSSTKFTEEALAEIITHLKSVVPYNNRTLTMGSTNLAKLTEDDKALATRFGWTLA